MSPMPTRVVETRARSNRSFRTHPAVAWRHYLVAIGNRDVEAVLEAMTVEYSRQLRTLRPTREFGPLFELWCASQPRAVQLVTCVIQGDAATLEGRDGEDLCRIHLRHVDGVWRIGAEEFIHGEQRRSR